MRNSPIQKLKNFQRQVFSRISSFLKFLPRQFWIILIAVVIVVVVVLLLFQSNLFLITKVEISELTYVEESKIEEITKKYVGERLVSVPTEKIYDQVLALSPYIRTLDVSKSFPDKLTVNITERKPAFKVLYKSTNNYYLIDKEQIILEDPTKEDAYGEGVFPSIVVEFNIFGSLSKKPRKKLEIPGLDYVIDLKIQLDNAKLPIDPSKDVILRQNSLEFHLKDGPRVLMKQSEKISDQIERLELILQDTKTKGKTLDYVDVSLEKPYGKYK